MKIFPNITRDITLPPEKKTQMWANIVDKIELSHISPDENVRMDDANRHTVWEAHTLPSPLSPNHKNMVNTKIFATMLVIIASIMGTSFAAERSVPGDALYAWKIGVNESVRGALNISAESDARWEIEKIERRAAERAELEARAEMTAKVETDLEARSQTSVEKVQSLIIKLKSQWNAQAAASVEGGLTTALEAMTSSNSRVDADAEADTKIKVDGEAVSDAAINAATSTAGSVTWSVQAEVKRNTSLSESVDADISSDLDAAGKLDLSNGIR